MYTSNKSTWLNPNIEYIFNEDIIEYDLRDAGFSIIREYKLLPPDVIKNLSSLDKGLERHVAIGKLQRENKEFSKTLTDKFAEIRRFFIMANDIKDSDIISVKKDAIFTIGEYSKLKFGSLTFVPKNRYSSYIRFINANNLEIYYSQEKLDIKGMSDSAVNRHRLYMLEFLKESISMIESQDSKVKRTLIKFIQDYKSELLDEEYYLEFNNLSKDKNKAFNFINIIIPIVSITLREVK